jgi:hypothetical protein
VSVGASPFSFCWAEEGTLEGRAYQLVRSMAAVKCKNKYPVGVIGREARVHYDEARNIMRAASAIEARRAETLGSVHESAVGDSRDAPNASEPQ